MFSIVTLPGPPGGDLDAVESRVRHEQDELLAVEVERSREVPSPLPVSDYLEVLAELSVDLDNVSMLGSGLVPIGDRALMVVRGWRDPRPDEVEAFRTVPAAERS